MIELLTAEPNLPFTAALGVMAALAVIEGLGLILGASPSNLLDSVLPDFDFDGPDLDLDLDVDADLDVDLDVDVDADVDADLGPGHSGPVEVLTWLRIGEVPFLVWLATYLTTFGLFGLLIQTIAHSLWGDWLPALLAAPLAFLGTLPLARGAVALLALVLPGDETSAVSEATFVGRVAVVTLGTASQGSPAQAKLQDEHGKTHYVMVEPTEEYETFISGTPVLLVQKRGAVFSGVRNLSEALID